MGCPTRDRERAPRCPSTTLPLRSVRDICLGWLLGRPGRLLGVEFDLAIDPAPPRTLRSGIAWGALTDVKAIGQGGSCDVFSATLDGEAVAVKIVSTPSDVATRDLESERALLAQLGERPHRHIIRLVGDGVHADGRPFVVLERLQATLAEELPKPMVEVFADLPTESDEVGWMEWKRMAVRWPLERALSVGLKLAAALHHLHHSQPIPGFRVLHRDLKPCARAMIDWTHGRRRPR